MLHDYYSYFKSHINGYMAGEGEMHSLSAC